MSRISLAIRDLVAAFVAAGAMFTKENGLTGAKKKKVEVSTVIPIASCLGYTILIGKHVLVAFNGLV